MMKSISILKLFEKIKTILSTQDLCIYLEFRPTDYLYSNIDFTSDSIILESRSITDLLPLLEAQDMLNQVASYLLPDLEKEPLEYSTLFNIFENDIDFGNYIDEVLFNNFTLDYPLLETTSILHHAYLFSTIDSKKHILFNREVFKGLTLSQQYITCIKMNEEIFISQFD